MTDPTPPLPSGEGFRARLLIDQYDRWKRQSTLAIWATLLVFIAGALVAALAQPRPGYDASRLGVHLLLDDGRAAWDEAVWPAHLEAAAVVVGQKGWVVQVVRADDRDADRWRRFLAICARLGLTPVLRLTTTFDTAQGWWRTPQPDDSGGYQSLAASAARFLAEIYTGSHLQPYVIVHNEPNNGHEWGGSPDAAAYARYFVDMRAAIRDALPGAVIMNAALDLYAPNTGTQALNGLRHSDADTFLTAMVAAEPALLTGQAVWNSHAYPQHFAALPDNQVFRFDAWGDGQVNAAAPPVGVVNRGINGYTWELWRLEQLGAPRMTVFISETGWRHSAGQAGTPYPSPQAQAQLWEIALIGNAGRYPDLPEGGWTPLLRDPRVIAVVAFALNGSPAEWATTNWLLLDASGSVRGQYPIYETQRRLLGR
jgi:hypothetical protein